MMKDLWPTRDDFMEDSVAKQPRKGVIENNSIAESTPPLSPRRPPMPRPRTKQAAPRKRQASDFENFGRRKRKCRSRHSKGSSSSFTGVPQANEFQVSDEEHEEERRGLYERGRDESMKQSAANEEPNYVLATANDLEASDNGSEKPGGEDMEDSIPDSQPDEVPASRFEIGEGPTSLPDLAIIAHGAFNLV